MKRSKIKVASTATAVYVKVVLPVCVCVAVCVLGLRCASVVARLWPHMERNAAIVADRAYAVCRENNIATSAKKMLPDSHSMKHMRETEIGREREKLQLKLLLCLLKKTNNRKFGIKKIYVLVSVDLLGE